MPTALKNSTDNSEITHFICLTMVLFPDSPAPRDTTNTQTRTTTIYNGFVALRLNSTGAISSKVPRNILATCYEEISDFLVTFALVQPVCPFVVSFAKFHESRTTFIADMLATRQTI